MAVAVGVVDAAGKGVAVVVTEAVGVAKVVGTSMVDATRVTVLVGRAEGGEVGVAAGSVTPEVGVRSRVVWTAFCCGAQPTRPHAAIKIRKTPWIACRCIE